MATRNHTSVVVGADGSDSSIRAVQWAASEASARGAQLRIIHAWSPRYDQLEGSTAGSNTGDPHKILCAAVAAASNASNDVEIRTELVTGSPQFVLTVASHEADLVVLGNRGSGGIASTLTGSVAVSLSRRAGCPVVIVRGEVTPTGRVVVGVEGVPSDAAILHHAFQRADRDKVPVLANHTWLASNAYAPTPRTQETIILEHQAAQELDQDSVR